jgi:hypothetical protein
MEEFPLKDIVNRLVPGKVSDMYEFTTQANETKILTFIIQDFGLEDQKLVITRDMTQLQF